MEKKYPSWNTFKAKYPSEQLQRDRFEDLARSLFCHRFGKEYGIFQCYNHAGNETDTIVHGNDIIGFNAKFFDHQIDKKQIMHSIQTAHDRNPNQTKILIYTNITFGNSPNKITQKQEDINNYATSLGITIEWITDRMILDQVIKIDWVYEFFFNIESPIEKLIKREECNTTSIFAPIRTSISTEKFIIKIDHSKEENQILDTIIKMKHTVIYGEGGSGKTSILKSIYETIGTTIPICVRKAQDFDKSSISHLFDDNIDAFLNAYKDIKNKVMVIDSAERLQCLDDVSTFESFIAMLKENGWIFLFTVRNGYLKYLLDDLHILYNINPVLVEIEPLNKETLKELALNKQFKLPLNETFRDRLCTLFYLDLYLKLYNDIDANDNYSKFTDLVWREKISGKKVKAGIAIKRSKLFLDFIEKRILNDNFYINDDFFELDEVEVIQLLVDDEVLAKSEKGLFITHDIFEEWGLKKLIDSKWNIKDSVNGFIESLDKSYLVRTAFRQWLTDRVESKVEETKDLLYISLDAETEQLWRDEILIAIMESSYADAFLENAKDELLKDDAKLLNRIIYLLQLACKRLDRVISFNGFECPLYVPFGSGWKAVIHVLYELRKSDIQIRHKTTILKEWTAMTHEGQTTREAGLLALEIWAIKENDHSCVYDEFYVKTLCEIIVNSAKEIRTEISTLINEIINNKWNSHRDPYYDLSHYILSNPLESTLLIGCVSDDIFPLMDLFWKFKKDESRTNSMLYAYENYSTNCTSLGLNNKELDRYYGQSWVFQTPLFTLLAANYWKAIEYIVVFMNNIVEYISNDKFRNEILECIKIYLRNGECVMQYGNYSLWGLYRGAIHITYPEIIPSMHMALEKFLLELSEDENNYKKVTDTFDYILSKSKSVSLTAVIASVILNHPEKFSTYAVNLFKTIELFQWDNIRHQDENMFASFYVIDSNKLAVKERLGTLQQSFRKRCLESLCIEYQYMRNSNMGLEEHNKLLNDIQFVLDDHYENTRLLDGEKKNIINILLHRIDRRKHNTKVSKTDDNQIQIEMNPQMPSDLKEYSDKTCNRLAEQLRYVNLRTWCIEKFRGEGNYNLFKEFEDNPRKAIQEVKNLINDIEECKVLTPMDYFVPANVAGVMILFYKDVLERDDLQFCKNIVEENIKAALNPNYNFQISNGLDLCIYALPNLISLYPKEKLNYINMLAALLCNYHMAGQVRICDYAIECLRRINDKQILETVTAHYVISMSDKKNNITSYVDLNKNLISKLDNFDIESAEVLFKLFPYGTDNDLYKLFINKISPILAQTLKQDDYKLHKSFYMGYRRDYIYNALAYHALNLKKENIRPFLTPFIECLNCNDYSLDFIRQFILVENEIQQKDSFWETWKILYETIVEKGLGWNDGVLQGFLLADYQCALEIGEWHSFNHDNLWLYDNATRDFCNSPATIYSIAKNLNYFASRFVDKGIEWLYAIVSKHPEIRLRDRERNTIFYMEKFIGNIVRGNRPEIRKDKNKKAKLITILTFMVERNSIEGFMLRDMIA